MTCSTPVDNVSKEMETCCPESDEVANNALQDICREPALLMKLISAFISGLAERMWLNNNVRCMVVAVSSAVVSVVDSKPDIHE